MWQLRHCSTNQSQYIIQQKREFMIVDLKDDTIMIVVNIARNVLGHWMDWTWL